VNDVMDFCPGTSAASLVDTNGCSPGQLNGKGGGGGGSGGGGCTLSPARTFDPLFPLLALAAALPIAARRVARDRRLPR
jgi:hypothetical protein